MPNYIQISSHVKLYNRFGLEETSFSRLNRKLTAIYSQRCQHMRTFKRKMFILYADQLLACSRRGRRNVAAVTD